MSKWFLFFVLVYFLQTLNFCCAMIDGRTRLSIIVWLSEGNLPREMRQRQACAIQLIDEFEKLVGEAISDINFFEQNSYELTVEGDDSSGNFYCANFDSAKNCNSIELIFKQMSNWIFWKEKIYKAFCNESQDDACLNQIENSLYKIFQELIGDFAVNKGKRDFIRKEFEYEISLIDGRCSDGCVFSFALENFVKRSKDLLIVRNDVCLIL